MSQSPKRILVVDDDLFTAELTGMALEAAGFEVAVAEGGIDALEKIAGEGRFDAVVSDMNMPIMSGAELYEELAKSNAQLPFVLLTGQDADAARRACPGLDTVLQKDENIHQALPELLCALLG